MQITYATSQGDGAANEDYAACGPDWAVILDGATHLPGVATGCIHDVPWLVRQLASGIMAGLMTGDQSLRGILADAIRAACAAHAGTCDLANPDSPSSTAAVIRVRENVTDYLVLGDSPVVLRRAAEVIEVADRRLDRLPGGRPYSRELVRKSRNAPGGFWVASTSVQAAREAISGSVRGVTEAAMLTDGVTRLVEIYDRSWRDVFTVLRSEAGAPGLIRLVRAAEEEAPPAAGKHHDDATVIHFAGIGADAGAPLAADRFIADGQEAGELSEIPGAFSALLLEQG